MAVHIISKRPRVLACLLALCLETQKILQKSEISGKISGKEKMSGDRPNFEKKNDEKQISLGNKQVEYK